MSSTDLCKARSHKNNIKQMHCIQSALITPCFLQIRMMTLLPSGEEISALDWPGHSLPGLIFSLDRESLKNRQAWHIYQRNSVAQTSISQLQCSTYIHVDATCTFQNSLHNKSEPNNLYPPHRSICERNICYTFHT